MPLEIRELNIRINLNDSGSNQDNSASSSSAGHSGSIAGEEAREALIAAVVEKVMTILKDKTER